MAQTLDVKTINDLIGMKFFIPKYQRGYRWDKTQVTALLEDITMNKQGNPYCLQPIVVCKKDDLWEVLDGQQRLTTIFIIIKYMAHCIPTEDFTLSFETRSDSSSFLNELKNTTKIDSSCIDYFYISSAMDTIVEWFSQYKNIPLEVINFYKKLYEDVQVLWYDIGENISEAEKIKIFTRLNIGKIPLTSAELIKALFLNESNFIQEMKENVESNTELINEKYAKLKQFEISAEWDQIENELHEDSFWAFVAQNTKKYDTRIEFLFELIVDTERAKKIDNFWVFLLLQNELNVKNKEKVIMKKWGKIKHIFSCLKEWYNDKKLYHYIGFLLYSGISLKEILSEYNNDKKTKSEFYEYVNNKIFNIIEKQIPVDKSLESLNYLDHSEEITKILLLHNIQTIISNNSDMIFNFEKFYSGKWSLEHIHAQNSEDLTTEKQWKDWVEGHRAYLEEGFIIPSPIKKEDFTKIAKKVYEKYSENNAGNHSSIDEIDHSISNLALLTSEDNSSLSNSIFPVKRKKILDLDKKGRFIPLCTKNVFLKFYNTDIDQHLSYWTDDDKSSYLNDIISKMNFFKGENNAK